MPIGLAVIGCGVIWRIRHKPALQNLKDKFSVKAVCDIREDLARDAASEMACDYTTDYSEAIKRDDVEAVTLLTPNFIRLDPIRLVCEERKPLYCEKPLAVDIKEAAEIRDMVKERGIVFTTEFVRRFFEPTIKLKELLRGEMGEARIITCEMMGTTLEESWNDWMNIDEKSGGQIVDYGVHIADLCRYLMGEEATEVLAYGGNFINERIKGNDFEVALVRFGERKVARIEVSRALKREWNPQGWTGGDRVRIVTTRGLVDYDPWNHVIWYSSEGRNEYRPSKRINIGIVLYENFHRFITSGEHPNPDIDDAYRATEITLAASLSMRERRPVALPLT
ncbi:MAG: Gfo/Idh/MocA family protein [bacterium]